MAEKEGRKKRRKKSKIYFADKTRQRGVNWFWDGFLEKKKKKEKGKKLEGD
jgi:hypothetical protein